MFCTLYNNAARVAEAAPKQPVTGPDLVPINVNLPFSLEGLGWGNWSLN